MRFGCCLNMVAGNADGTGIERIGALTRAGYDYVELPLAEMMQLSEPAFGALQDALEKHGVRCEACNNFFPKTMRLTGAQADPMGETLDYVERALARAEGLGVRKVVFGSGGAKQAPAGYPIEKGYLQVVELLRAIGPIAKKHGVTVVIEPLRRAECNLINSFEEGCRLADDADDPQVKVLADYYHMSEENEPAEHVARLAPGHLAHLHFANPDGRVYPHDGDGHDYSAFVRAVRSAGYADTMSCEAYSDNYERDAARTLAFLRTAFEKEG